MLSVSFPVLTTERLILRQLEMEDAREIFNLRSDSEINKYLDRPISTSIDEARNFISEIVENNALYWAITLSDRNILVGTICLFSFSEENDKCEIGYELLTKYHGQGIMKETAEKVIDYAFSTMKVQRIEAFFHRDNLRSINLLEKLLFKKSNESERPNASLLCYYLTNPVDKHN